MSKARLIDWALSALLIVVVLAIPFGAVMGFYTDNGWWFCLCGLIVLFLSDF